RAFRDLQRAGRHQAGEVSAPGAGRQCRHRGDGWNRSLFFRTRRNEPSLSRSGVAGSGPLGARHFPRRVDRARLRFPQAGNEGAALPTKRARLAEVRLHQGVSRLHAQPELLGRAVRQGSRLRSEDLRAAPTSGRGTSSMFQFTLNGQNVAVEADKNLLEYLRADARMTSVKDGCAEGVCGTCSVIVSGKAVRACTLTVAKVHGKSVITSEG